MDNNRENNYGIEVHKNMITGKTEIKKIDTKELNSIHVQRDSICFGDDVTAPHETWFSFKKDDKLSDLFNKLMNKYLDNLSNKIKWKIIANDIVLGFIIYSEKENPKFELRVPDDLIINLNIKTVYCSNKGGYNEN